jgi:endoglucanase
MKLKKIAIALALTLALTACGLNPAPGVSDGGDQPVVTEQNQNTEDEGNTGDEGNTDPVTDPEPVQEPEPEPEPLPEPADPAPFEFITDCGTTTLNGYTVKPIPDNEAFEYILGMHGGMNLGNAFDASDCNWLTNELDYESAWCGAKTTTAYIDSLCREGYNVLRVPVSWHNHVDSDYNISEEWLARVTEVVDYALSKDMYVIVNIHHDVDKKYFYPDSEHLNNTLKYTETIWRQVAINFQDRSNKLIFECINEPRLKGTNNEWWFSSENDAVLDAYDALMRANQCFVDTVRDTGGNNADRYLMVCGYCHMPSATTSQNFSLPYDTAENKIIVSVHSYRPYEFAGDVSGTATFGAPEERENKQVFSSLYDRYVANGIPVIIGEYGCIDKSNPLDRVHYYEFMGECSALYTIPIIAWDNNVVNNTGGVLEESFGFIDRATGNVVHQDLVDAMTDDYIQ